VFACLFSSSCPEEFFLLPHKFMCKKFAHGLYFMNCCPILHLTFCRRKKVTFQYRILKSQQGERKSTTLLMQGYQRHIYPVLIVNLNLTPPFLKPPTHIPLIIPVPPLEALKKIARIDIIQYSTNPLGQRASGFGSSQRSKFTHPLNHVS